MPHVPSGTAALQSGTRDTAWVHSLVLTLPGCVSLMESVKPSVPPVFSYKPLPGFAVQLK